jgi:glycosyltransferase involved in cell wall biosynthesis
VAQDVFRPCAVIPTYNHHEKLKNICAALIAQSLSVLIVDDGNRPEIAAAIGRAAAGMSGVSIIRRAENGGKGAAVLTGLAAAHERGHTHALQIDADGQHDPAAAAEFLRHGREQPDTIICGAAKYDDTVPLVRKYGRYLTHICVWAETGSLTISDSLCGFRLYPLAPMLAMLARTRIGRRMDFDAEVLVKAFWAGIPVRMLPVDVIYPPGNSSNFRGFRDNALISWMHTRLLVQAPFRIAGRHVRRMIGPTR